MNKLNNPIVILTLIILSIGNFLLSISILAKINKENDIVENVDSNIEQLNQTETTEPTTQSKKEDLHFTIYNTFGDKHKYKEGNWQTDKKYEYGASKEQNYRNRLCDVQNYCEPLFTVSCNDEQCLISVYSRDSNGNLRSEAKLYSADVSKTISDKVKYQEEIAIDLLIEETETTNGQIVREFKDLPSVIIIMKDQGYYIDDALLNYINSLR